MLTPETVELLRAEVGQMDVGASFTLKEIVAKHSDLGDLSDFSHAVSSSIKDINDMHLDFIVYNEILPNGRPAKTDDGLIIFRRLR